MQDTIMPNDIIFDVNFLGDNIKQVSELLKIIGNQDKNVKKYNDILKIYSYIGKYNFLTNGFLNEISENKNCKRVDLTSQTVGSKRILILHIEGSAVEISDMQYIMLLLQIIEYFDDYAVVINPSKQEDLYRFSQFLLLELLRYDNDRKDFLFYNRVFIKGPNNFYQKPPTKIIGSLGSFIPIVELSEETYKILSEPLNVNVTKKIIVAEEKCTAIFTDPNEPLLKDEEKLIDYMASLKQQLKKYPFDKADSVIKEIDNEYTKYKKKKKRASHITAICKLIAYFDMDIALNHIKKQWTQLLIEFQNKLVHINNKYQLRTYYTIKDANNISEISEFKKYIKENQWDKCNDFIKTFYNVLLIDTYMELIRQSNIDNVESELEKLTNDSFLSGLLYYSMLSRMEDVEQENLDLILERCKDFSQGILQLCENAVEYSKKGYLLYRICKRDKMILSEPIQLLKKNCKLKAKYFLEVYVSDISKVYDGKIYNIITMFKKNVNQRCKENNIIPPTFEDIQLRHIFEGGNKELENFYSDPDNIIYHYGIRILDSIVNCNDGMIRVTSGDNINGFYCRGREDSYNMQYIKNMTSYLDGTQYHIIMPLEFKEDIEKIPYISMELPSDSEKTQLDCSDITDKLENYMKRNLQSAISVNHKEKSGHIDKLSKIMDFSEDNIMVIDFGRLKNLNMSFDIVIELISKAIFKSIVNNQQKPSYSALINFQSLNDVLKTVRVFSLFFNKNGINQSLNNTQIYFVDKDASTEMLFTGVDVNSMLSSLERNRLLGGVSSRIIDQVKYAFHINLKKGENENE